MGIPEIQHVVIGTMTGTFVLVQVNGADNFQTLGESEPYDGAVADLCYSKYTRNVVVAYASGELRCWSISGLGPYKDTGISCDARRAPVRVASLGSCLAVAFGCGSICIYSADDLQIQAEIKAHARLLTAMDVHEEKRQIASVGEDTFLHVWEVQDTPSCAVSLVSSRHVTDSLLTGVVLQPSSVHVVGYDSKELFSLPL